MTRRGWDLTQLFQNSLLSQLFFGFLSLFLRSQDSPRIRWLGEEQMFLWKQRFRCDEEFPCFGGARRGVSDAAITVACDLLWVWDSESFQKLLFFFVETTVYWKESIWGQVHFKRAMEHSVAFFRLLERERGEEEREGGREGERESEREREAGRQAGRQTDGQSKLNLGVSSVPKEAPTKVFKCHKTPLCGPIRNIIGLTRVLSCGTYAKSDPGWNDLRENDTMDHDFIWWTDTALFSSVSSFLFFFFFWRSAWRPSLFGQRQQRQAFTVLSYNVAPNDMASWISAA